MSEDDEITPGGRICSVPPASADFSSSRQYKPALHTSWQLHQHGAHLSGLRAHRFCSRPQPRTRYNPTPSLPATSHYHTPREITSRRLLSTSTRQWLPSISAAEEFLASRHFIEFSSCFNAQLFFQLISSLMMDRCVREGKHAKGGERVVPCGGGRCSESGFLGNTIMQICGE